MTIRVDGAAGKRYQLESSPDLIDWTELHVLDNGQTMLLRLSHFEAAKALITGHTR